MASLSDLLKKTRIDTPSDDGGLSKGLIYTFAVTSNTDPFSPHGCANGNNFCWQSPGQGKAVIEIWGGSGNSARNCCCLASVPGNPGAYAKKTICVTRGDFVCGLPGRSTNSTSTVCCNGACSCSTRLCWVTGRFSGCMCAMGGKGGYSFCSCNIAPYCRFICVGFPGTQIGGAGCGIICNYSNDATYGLADDWMACAYGGDVNCCGGFSCSTFLHCNPCCACCMSFTAKTAPGVFAENGGQVIAHHSYNEGSRGDWGFSAFTHGLAALSRSPTEGTPYNMCWCNAQHCSNNGCVAGNSYPYLGVGVPGMAVSACNGTGAEGNRGGQGGIRIQFIPDTPSWHEQNDKRLDTSIIP